MNNLDKLIIKGKRPLCGEVKVSGAKNAALPLMTISLMINKGFELTNVPNLLDTKIMKKIINELGVETRSIGDKINFHGLPRTIEVSENLVNKMRASILILSPLLQSQKQVRIPLPGGCAIGSRPIDMHIDVIKKLGARVNFQNNFLEAFLPDNNFFGNELNFKKVSVGATECAILAAVLAKGKTILINAAREPEIVDLGRCLNKAGAKIRGLGQSNIIIEGVNQLNPISYSVVSDRIEAGSFAIAAAITKGNISLKNVETEYLTRFINKLQQSGAKLNISKNELNVIGVNKIKSVNISTKPYPGFPTDLQSPFMSMMCLADGISTIEENIFENRFQHVPELEKMGAKITLSKKKAFITGIDTFEPAKLKATDLRASMCLILASLATHGKSEIFELEHLYRGYENIKNKLANLGADIN